MKKTFTIVVPTFNEEENVADLFEAIRTQMTAFEAEVSWTVRFIDNDSTDATRREIEKINASDARAKAIFNRRNYGHIRSPFAGMLDADTDGVALMAADFQDPPEALAEMVRVWLKGEKLVLAQRITHADGLFLKSARGLFYYLIDALSEARVPSFVTGFGIYDREVVDGLRGVDDRYPFLRGLVVDLGFKPHLVQFKQNARRRGLSKNNFMTLYDMALLAIVKHSVVPLRIASAVGFLLAVFSVLMSAFFVVNKLLNWNEYSLGMAPFFVVMTFLFSINFLIIGMFGEYLIVILRNTDKRPVITIEKRID